MGKADTREARAGRVYCLRAARESARVAFRRAGPDRRSMMFDENERGVVESGIDNAIPLEVRRTGAETQYTCLLLFCYRPKTSTVPRANFRSSGGTTQYKLFTKNT
eukprot:267364-Rhodomonas_salina.4